MITIGRTVAVKYTLPYEARVSCRLNTYSNTPHKQDRKLVKKSLNSCKSDVPA